jgi:hypothetical protein
MARYVVPSSNKRPLPYMPYRRMHEMVRSSEGRPVSSPVNPLIPESLLRSIAPNQSMHLDALTHSTRSHLRHGRMGRDWVPDTRHRGLLARAALRVAFIGPGASETVNDVHVAIDLVIEWDYDHPPCAWEIRRYSLIVEGQGAYALRAVGPRKFVWVPESANLHCRQSKVHTGESGPASCKRPSHAGVAY